MPDAVAVQVLRPIASPVEIVRAHEETTAVLKRVLKVGTDFGKVPGTQKNTLYKAGAERIMLAFGAHAEMECIEKEVDHARVVPWVKRRKEWDADTKAYRVVTEGGESFGLYRYVYLCRVMLGDGRVLGECQGVASTMEAKYIDRPRECENTVLKMAQKRALVGAVLLSFGLSDRWTTGEDEAAAVAATKDIYEGGAAEKKALFAYLKSVQVPETYWQEVSDSLIGKAKETADDVIAQVRAGGAS